MNLDTGWGYDVQAIHKDPILLILISCFLFSQWPRNGQKVHNLWVSVGCLEGVWEVSGGCLDDSGYCLGGYNAISCFYLLRIVKPLLQHV